MNLDGQSKTKITYQTANFPAYQSVTKPLEDDSILFGGRCHVDHEGFDLNEIEQAYYSTAGIGFQKDDTWYKDGDGFTTAIIQPWVTQIDFPRFEDNDEIVLDHSHFVFKYPIRGQAELQVREASKSRRELLRLVSTKYKCGLDLCLDLYTGDSNIGRVEPVVHIEWDFLDPHIMNQEAIRLVGILESVDWYEVIPNIKQYNKKALSENIDAFTQADYRSNTIFGDKSYKLVSTL